MEREPLITRAEVEAILFAIHDVNANVGTIVRLLEDEDDGEDPEDES